jgi:PAS domain S-box-containing protein
MSKALSHSICLEISSPLLGQQVKAYLNEQFPNLSIFEGLSPNSPDRSSPALVVLEHPLASVDNLSWLEQHPVPEKVILLCADRDFLPEASPYQKRILACLPPHQLTELAEQIAKVFRHDSPLNLDQYQGLNVLIDSAMDAIVIVDSHHCIERLNPAGEKMFLISESEIKKKPLNLLIPPRFRSKHNDKIDEFSKTSLSTRKMGMDEYVWGLRSDGKEFPIEVSLLRFDLDGHLHLGAIIRDISKRLQTEQNLKAQAQLIDLIEDAIIVEDLEQHILFWNKGAEKTYGYKRDEVLGESISELVFQQVQHDAFILDNKQSKDDKYTQILQNGYFSAESLSFTKTGKKRLVNSRYILMTDQQGQAESILSVHTDITAKKELEAQLLRSQRMESIGTLAAGISHDLSNLLTPILLTSELMIQDPTLSSIQQQQLLTIKQCSEQTLDILQQILTFARRSVRPKEPVNPLDILSKIQRIIQRTFPSHIRIQTQIENDLWYLHADAPQIEQSLLNLCVNARDAMPEDGELILLSQNIFLNENAPQKPADVPSGPFVLFSVQDTGMGIASEHYEQIFDPFFTTKRLGLGSGLGLSSCLGIARDHGGFIHFHSKQGEGSCFQIYLPALLVSELNPKETPVDIASLRGQDEWIQIVEYPPTLANVLKQTLSHHGYQVMIANNALEAIVQATSNQESCFATLISLDLPDMKGALLGQVLESSRK